MKSAIKIVLVLLIGFCINPAKGENPTVEIPNGPRFEYLVDNNRLDMGTIFIDELKEFNIDVHFTNTGNEPLIVSNVRGCCGTHIADWTKAPILQGDSAVIKIRFRLAQRVQSMNRTVTATSNDPTGQKILRMTMQVIERPEVEVVAKPD
jgi:hypothetical protein